MKSTQMKKITLAVFIVIPFVCRTEYDSTYIPAVAEKDAIPGNVFNGDDAGNG
jgi:hypothetical protein